MKSLERNIEFRRLLYVDIYKYIYIYIYIQLLILIIMAIYIFVIYDSFNFVFLIDCCGLSFVSGVWDIAGHTM